MPLFPDRRRAHQAFRPPSQRFERVFEQTAGRSHEDFGFKKYRLAKETGLDEI